MVNNRSIDSLKSQIRNTVSASSYSTLLIDLLTTNWSSMAFKPNELISLFLEIPKNPLFNSNSIDLIVKYLPLSTSYTTILVNGFLVELIENATISNIQHIYQKFGSFVQVEIELAKHPLTPKEILEELIRSDYVSVIAAISENDGDDAKELMSNEDIREHILYAQKMIDYKFS